MANSRDLPAEIEAKERERGWRGMIRRFVTGAIGKVKWQIVGHRLLDGTTETHDAEAFSGIGFYSKPGPNGKPEVIVVSPGAGAAQPCIVGFRDEATRQAIADLAADETAIFTSQAIVVIKADGTIEIRSKNGTAVPLATKADVQFIKDAVHANAGTGAGFGAALDTSLQVAGFPAGTSKLKAE